MSYEQLDRRRRVVRDALVSHGIENARVGLICAKGIRAYAGLLGIMSSGSAYVPIDPSCPMERLHAVIRAAAIQTIVLDSSSLNALSHWLVDSAPPLRLVVMTVGDVSLSDQVSAKHDVVVIREGEGDIGSSPDPKIAPESIAYVMFTSGSTGVPKGVPVSHANVAAMLHAVQKKLEFRPEDRFSQFTDLMFDFSVGEMFLCWGSGACLYVPVTMDRIDPCGYIVRNALTVWSSVPSMAGHALRAHQTDQKLASLRISLFCGEALTYDIASFWSKLSENADVINLYGPTEVAVFATIFRFDPGDSALPDPIPIGEPLDGVSYRIKSVEGSQTTCGTGELLLAGPQVFGGYLTSGAKESAFDVDPETGDHWYRTGDLVEIDERYGLLFRGRFDQQIKLRGYRIELQDVETAIRATINSRVAVVAAYDTHGKPTDLVAFILAAAPDDFEIKQLCAKKLPSYMIPRYFCRLDELPLNANGKIDYKALKAAAAITCTSNATLEQMDRANA